MTVEQLIDIYALHRISVSQATLDQYRYTCRSLERFYGRPVLVSELSLTLISPWLRHRYQTQRPGTAKRERGDISTLWKFAWSRRLCSEPFEQIPPIAMPVTVPTAMTLGQFEGLLEQASLLRGRVKGTIIPRWRWWRSSLLAIYDTAARSGALYLVASRDIDLREGFILLRPENAKTKLGQACRISEQTAHEISHIYDPDRPLMWPGIRKRSRLATLHKLAAAAGIPVTREYGFHCIRRTTATQITKHDSIEAASRALGHSSVRMTLKYVDPRQITGNSAVALLPRPGMRSA